MDYDGKPLCGVRTTEQVGEVCKWPSVSVTWAIAATLPGFAMDAFRLAIDEAWSYWTAVCGIRPMMLVGASANITIGLQTAGPGGVLADCELPCGASIGSKVRMRIDTSEAWVIAENPPGNKVDLVRVVAHELGHALGIPHIGAGNLMAPTYSSSIRRPRAGDAAEAVARYGLPVPISPTPSPPSADGLQEIAAILARGGELFIRANGITRQL